jgi:hypothetical protein
MMKYREVHIYERANLHWSGLVSQCQSVAAMAHRNFLVPSHNARWHNPLCGAFEGGNQTFTDKVGGIHRTQLKAHKKTTMLTPQV